MTTLNERIKQVRKESGLSQELFGSRLGITKSSVSLLESGKNNPSEQTLKLICTEFNINYNWLLNGTEPMAAQNNISSMARIDAIMTGENEFAKSTFKEFAKLDKSEWELLEKIIKKLSEEL